MRPEPRLELRLPLDPARLLRARHRIRDYLHSQGADPMATNDAVLAIQEAMSNVVAHSHASDDLEVDLHFEGNDLFTIVRDHGVGFDVEGVDVTQCPDVDALDHRGLYLISQLMDELWLSCGDGLEVRAVKRAARDRGSGDTEGARSWTALSHERERAVLDEIDEGFFSLDWEYRYTAVNMAFERTYGLTRDELLGRTVWDSFPLIRENEIAYVVRNAMELGRSTILEYLSPTVDRWLEVRVYPGAAGVTGYVREIGERKRRELERDEILAALRESERRYRELVNSANSAIVRWSRDGAITFFNERAEELFGWTAEEVAGRHVSILVPAEDSTGADLSQLVAGIVDHPERYAGNTNENVCRDGRRIWVAWTNRAIYDKEGQVGEILAVGTDVTEQRLAYEALKESDEKLRAAFAHAAIGFALATPEGRLTEANPAFCALTGYDLSELHGRALTQLIHTDDTAEYLALVDRMLRDELADFVLENRCLRKDGSCVRVRESVSLARDAYNAPRWIIALVEDVSEHKHAEEALRESDQRLVQNELRLRLALDAASLISFEWDVESDEVHYYSTDPGLAPTADALPVSFSAMRDLVHPDDREAFAARVDAAFARDDGAYENEYRVVLAPDKVAWIYERGRAERQAEGRPARLIGVSQDVTGRRETEDALRSALAERTRLAEERAQQTRQMTLLAEMAKTASSALEVRDLAQRLVAAVHTLIEPSHVCLALPDAADQLHVVATSGFSQDDLQGIGATISETGELAQAFRSAEQQLLVSPCEPGASQDAGMWAEQTGIVSFAAIPLASAGRPVGVLGLGWTTPHRFTDEEVTLLDLMATEIAVGLANARRFEAMHHAALMLREAFVHPLPTIPSLDLAMLSLPARHPELVGGDFHDVYELRDGLVVALIGDVMGKGVKAAGLAETMRSAIRALSFSSTSPGNVLRYVNRLLLTLEYDAFASALVAVFDPRSGRGRLASAGHPPPALLHHGEPKFIEPRYGPVLGAFSAGYATTDFVLPPDAALVIYTDGLIEARRHGELFGEARLLETLREVPDTNPQRIVDHVRESVAAFADELSDDLEIIALRSRAPGGQ